MAANDAKNKGSKLGASNSKPLTDSSVEDYTPSPFSIDGIRTGAKRSRIAKGFVLLSGGVMALGFILTSLSPNLNLGGPQAPNAPVGTAATVGSQSISGKMLAASFERQMNSNAQYGFRVGVTDYLRSKQGALSQLTDEAAKVNAAYAAGLNVSGAEIDEKIEKELDDSIKGGPGSNPAEIRRMIESQYGSVDKWKEKTRQSFQRDLVSNSLLVEKLEKKVKEDNKVTEEDYKRSVTKLKLWQIVLRPKFPSPTTKDFKAEQEKNNKAVAEKALSLFTTLKSQPTLVAFQNAAAKNNEDEVTKKKNGDLGWKLPAEVTAGPEVGDALSKSSSSLVGPLADKSGNQYLYFIENRQTALPKDFEKNKKKLLADFETQKDNDALTAKQEEWKKAYTPYISDPALAAFQIQMEQVNQAPVDEQKKLRADAVSRYQGSLKGLHGMEAAAVGYQLSQLYVADGDKINQLASLQNAVKEWGTDAQLHVEYARALRENNKSKEAVAQLVEASKALDDAPAAPSMFAGYNPNDSVRQQIASEFDMNNEKGKAAAERAKVKPAAPGGMGGFGGNIQVR